MTFFHHVVDLLNCQTKPAGLKARGEVRLHHALEIAALVEVVASDLRHVFRQVAAAFEDGLRGDGRGILCHRSCPNERSVFREWSALIVMHRELVSQSKANLS